MTFFRLIRNAKKRLINRPYKRGKYLYHEDFSSFLLGCFFAFVVIFMILLEVLICYMFKHNITFPDLFQYLFPPPPLVNTPVCRIDDLPIFDKETKRLFQKNARLSSEICTPKFMQENFTIRRVNYTWIEIDGPVADQWFCVGREVQRKAETDYLRFGKDNVYLKTGLNDLTAQVMREKFVNNSSSSNNNNSSEANRWDTVFVYCLEKTSSSSPQTNQSTPGNLKQKPKSYTQVVPLVQHYHAKVQQKVEPGTQYRKPNILLLGIDSFSRLHFHRHLPLTKALLEEKGFQPLYGYHKVGENSFPNVLPILSGRPLDYFFPNDSSNASFLWDNVHLIFDDLHQAGYLTTYIEDMPEYGFFNYDHRGFYEQPTHYYLRPFNWAINQHRNRRYCYKDRLECEVYYEYILDQISAFRERGNQRFFIFNHESTLTHDTFNSGGLLDAPLHRTLEAVFSGGHHSNTVIVLFSDHALRIGSSTETASAVHESRLPLFYIYLPEGLVLDGGGHRRGVEQLRAALATNAHRLTSHFDLHATLMHLITGEEQQQQPYGKSLIGAEPVSLQRSCADAGIPPKYCYCSPMQLPPALSLTSPLAISLANRAVEHINSVVSRSYAAKLCRPLSLLQVSRVMVSTSVDSQGKQLVMVLFCTLPNDGRFEALIQLDGSVGGGSDGDDNSGDNADISSLSSKVLYTNRLNSYDRDGACVPRDRIISPLCLCNQSYYAYYHGKRQIKY